MFTLPLALGGLGVESLLRYRSLLGALVFRDCYAPIALASLGIESLLRHCSLLGASVLIIVYVTVSSWEPWS